MPAPDIRPAVVAYDGSAEAQAAVRQAVALLGHRPLVVATVWEAGLAAMTMASAPGEMGMTNLPDPEEVAAVDRAVSDRANAVAEDGARLARELGATVEAVSVPESVDAAETLASIAEERAASAIVVGSRGLGAIKARVLGSTSRKLLHHTRLPVLVVRAPE
jgi:nucleotide-binding universal stress UspA family protein